MLSLVVVLMVYNQELHVILDYYYQWAWYWKNALVVPLNEAAYKLP